VSTPIPPTSERAAAIPPALSIHINEIVYALKRRGQDITTLSLGEAFFDIPLFDFAKIDFVRGYHYSDSQGLPELRKQIAEFYEEQYGSKVDGDKEILITAGSKAAIYLAVLAAVDPGCEVLIHEPAWLSYREHVNLAEAEPKFIPFDAAPQDFEQWFTDKSRMLIINNPNNPAGRLYTREDLIAIIDICRKRKVWLMVDEAYSDFIGEGTFVSALDLDTNRDVVIVANSLSKNMGMSGWRIGYIVANPVLIREVLKLNQHIITCAPTVLQAYLAKYFKQIIQITLPQAREVVEKRARLAKRMAALGLNCLPGSATFYFFVDTGDYPYSTYDLSLYLLLFHNIAVVSGSAYGASTARFLRLSIGTESEERIVDAFAVIANVLSEPRDYRSTVDARLQELGLNRFGGPGV